jgi:predicted RND superfamily exporter protein
LRRLSDQLIRARWALAAVIAAATVMLVTALFPIRYDFAFTTLFIGEGEAYEQLREYIDRFGTDVNQIAVVLEVDDVFDARVLREVRRLSDELAGLESADRVLSITTVEALSSQGSTLVGQTLVPDVIPEDPEALATIREHVLSNRRFGEMLVSGDERATAVLLKLGWERNAAACDDGLDNDGDGQVDCQDSVCPHTNTELCGRPGPEASPAECSDDTDNDDDGRTDCDDPGCRHSPICSATEPPTQAVGEGGRLEVCQNDRDDDGDGHIDCLDPECWRRAGDECRAIVGVEQIVERSRVRLAAQGVPVLIRLAGVPYVHKEYVNAVRRDQRTSIPIAVVTVAVMLFFLFRSVRAVILPLLATGLAVTWTLALMMLTGEPLNMINSVVPVLILVIGVADSVHLLSRYQHEVVDRGRVRVAVRAMLRSMLPACFLTSLTSAVGFGSLTSATLPIIRHFGLYSAIGVGIAFFLTIVIIPTALFHLPAPPAAGRLDGRSFRITRLLDRWVDVLLRRRKPIALISVGCVAAMLSGLVLIHRNSQLMSELREGAPAREHNEYIESHLFGVLSNALVIESDERNGMAEPEVLRAIDEISRWSLAYVDPDSGRRPVSHTLSIVDLVREGYAAYTGNPENDRVPDTRAAVISILSQLPGEMRARAISLDNRVAHLTLLSRDLGTRGWNPFRERLDQKVRQVLAERGLADDYHYHLTGSSTLAQAAIDNILRDLMTSIALAFGVILLLMSALFRSFRVGLLSMVPNVLPLLCTLGLIGFLGIPLRMSTVIIFSIALGIAVDDTIHLLARLREEQARGGSYEATLRRAIRETGRPIVFTTVLLVVGFSTLVFSQFVAVYEMGILGSFTLVVALIADLVVLPLLLLRFQPDLTRGLLPRTKLLDEEGALA